MKGQCSECGVENTDLTKVYLPNGLRVYVCDRCFPEVNETPLDDEAVEEGEGG